MKATQKDFKAVAPRAAKDARVIALQHERWMMPALDSWTNDMDLLLWRHAEAVDGTPDHLRRKLYRTTIEGDVPF